MQICVFNLFNERKKKRKIKAHQWSLNLLSWCLSHWSMIMTYFVLWTVFKYLFFPVMLSSLNNGDVFRLNVSVMNSQKWTMFYFWQYTFFFLIVCLFLYILAVPEWQNILNVSHYVAVAQENRNNSYDNNNKKKKNMTKWYQAPFSWWSSVLLYCHPLRKKKKVFLSLIISQKSQHFVQMVQFCVCVPISLFNVSLFCRFCKHVCKTKIATCVWWWCFLYST